MRKTYFFSCGIVLGIVPRRGVSERRGKKEDPSRTIRGDFAKMAPFFSGEDLLEKGAKLEGGRSRRTLFSRGGFPTPGGPILAKKGGRARREQGS